VLISDNEVRVLTPCGVFPPPQGHKPHPKEVLAYFMTIPSSNHAITLPARTASPAAQSAAGARACAAARSSSQQQPAASISQRCCHSTKHQEAPPQAGAAPVCRCSVEAYARISGSELRSPAPCNQLVSDQRSPLQSAQGNAQALAA
jgi:hypothetical protein